VWHQREADSANVASGGYSIAMCQLPGTEGRRAWQQSTACHWRHQVRLHAWFGLFPIFKLLDARDSMLEVGSMC
jgi:hypothetical protein